MLAFCAVEKKNITQKNAAVTNSLIFFLGIFFANVCETMKELSNIGMHNSQRSHLSATGSHASTKSCARRQQRHFNEAPRNNWRRNERTQKSASVRSTKIPAPSRHHVFRPGVQSPCLPFFIFFTKLLSQTHIRSRVQSRCLLLLVHTHFTKATAHATNPSPLQVSDGAAKT